MSFRREAAPDAGARTGPPVGHSERRREHRKLDRKQAIAILNEALATEVVYGRLNAYCRPLGL
ncbi:MAG TPA: hypothetical protein VNY82_19565, partial [Steroidobacteraceae bacterium]|nr:hypothetical protein [Steroidobacteraceae bacterium]